MHRSKDAGCNRSLDHLVGAQEERLRDREPERLGRLEVDHQLEFRGQHDRQVGWLVAFEDAAGVDARLAIGIRSAGSVAEQATGFGDLAISISRRHGMACHQRDKFVALGKEEEIGADKNAPIRCWTMAAKASSMWPSVLALRSTVCWPIACDAACAAAPSNMLARLFGFTSTAITVAVGTSSRSSSNRLVTSGSVKKVTPVTLPPGRLRLVTSPDTTGSLPIAKTIGIVAVAALAASAVGVPLTAAITAT